MDAEFFERVFGMEKTRGNIIKLHLFFLLSLVAFVLIKLRIWRVNKEK